jgi:hypothetical protein
MAIELCFAFFPWLNRMAEDVPPAPPAGNYLKNLLNLISTGFLSV